MPEFTSPKLEEFYNHVHDPATGRFSGRAASGRGPQHGNRGGPHIRAADKLPLRNATTGRLNPRPARAAFKQGTDEIIGKKQDSKRTTLTGPKVRTVKTYKGRVISHVSSKGGPAKSEKIGKVPASSHIDYDRVIKNLNAHTQEAVNFFRGT